MPDAISPAHAAAQLPRAGSIPVRPLSVGGPAMPDAISLAHAAARLPVRVRFPSASADRTQYAPRPRE
jgi:hypothetical protein